MAASNDASTPSFSMYGGLHFGSHTCEALKIFDWMGERRGGGNGGQQQNGNSEMAPHLKCSLYRMRRNARPARKIS